MEYRPPRVEFSNSVGEPMSSFTISAAHGSITLNLTAYEMRLIQSRLDRQFYIRLRRERMIELIDGAKDFGELEAIAKKYGIADLCGNVGEWCLDHWTTNLCSLAGNIATNPPGPAFADKGATGNTQYNRVLRGGNVSSAADVFRSAARRPQWITTTPFTGFRVVALNVKLEE